MSSKLEQAIWSRDTGRFEMCLLAYHGSPISKMKAVSELFHKPVRIRRQEEVHGNLQPLTLGPKVIKMSFSDQSAPSIDISKFLPTSMKLNPWSFG